MSEDLSSQPWSINKDDYELQEVIGKRPGKRTRVVVILGSWTSGYR